MNWFYVVGGQQLGPVSDAELAEKLRQGEINSDTLVWREGMAEWQPLSVAQPNRTTSPPTLTLAKQPDGKCVECGNIFPADELVKLNHTWVCASCKPIFLQRMAEGVATSGGPGVWRQGKRIFTVSETVFPDRCIKCNAPTNGFRMKRVLYWQHPAYLLLLLCNLLVLLIVVLIVRKKAVLHIGLCEAHRKQRQIAIIACVTGLLGAIALFCVAGVMESGWTAVAGVVLLLTGIVWGIWKGRTIAATKIDKEKVWVAGAGKPFLDSLPERPN